MIRCERPPRPLRVHPSSRGGDYASHKLTCQRSIFYNTRVPGSNIFLARLHRRRKATQWQSLHISCTKTSAAHCSFCQPLLVLRNTDRSIEVVMEKSITQRCNLGTMSS